MHDVFLISEVLDCIIDYLAQDIVRHPQAFHATDIRKGDRQALAILARTCRAFSEPALDALWRRLHSLRPLVLCLATKVPYADTTVDGALWPAFDDTEWDTLLRYTPRVQELILERDPFSMKILHALWFRTTLLLPNLRKLHWYYEDYTAIAPIRLLLSPSLVHLHVWLDSGDHNSVLGFLECYHILCPNLKSLYLGHLFRFPHVPAAVSRAITRVPDLEELTCESIQEGALTHIANSRRLKKLGANLLNYRPEDLKRLAEYSTPDYFPFENLRILELRIEDLSSIIPYLRSHQQPFKEVSFDFRIHPTPEVFQEFFSALGSTTRRRTLRQIKLSSIGLRNRGRPPQAVDFEVLGSLRTFNLHVFNLNIVNSVSLSDEELDRLIQAWPDLETFHFNQRSGWDYSPEFHVPTLRGLLLLVVRCPKLRKIGLCVDARHIPSLAAEEASIRNTAVKRLSLANSPIQQPVSQIAQFLLEHFPSLTALPMGTTFSGPLSHDYLCMWREVRTLVQGSSFDDLSESSDGLSDELP